MRVLSKLPILFAAIAAGSLAPVVACGPSSESGAGGGDPGPDGAVPCNVEPPTECPDPAPTYVDVKPIFDSRCVVCHDGEFGGPWPLVDYPHVADWRTEIRGELQDCSMPPADAGFTISDEERTAILTWILCGARE
jgi:hypothetical protein